MKADLTFGWGTIDEGLLFGLEDLLHLNWEEIESNQDKVPLAINWASYRDFERRGILKAGYLRKKGVLIGYTVWFLHEPMHHGLTKWAINDMIWLDPEHRKSLAGIWMLQEAERLLLEAGAKVITINTKVEGVLASGKARDRVSRILLRLGYHEAERVMMKVV